MRSESGQATVESIAVVPIVAALVLAFGLTAVSIATRVASGEAAEAAAIAMINGSAPRVAAARSIPGWARNGLSVRVTRRSIETTLLPVGVPAQLAGLVAGRAKLWIGPDR